MTGLILVALERSRWALPRGALTVVLGINALLMGFAREQLVLVPGAVLAGVLGDVLLVYLRPSPARRAELRIVPAAFFFHFVLLTMTKGVWWSVHLTAGSVVLAGVVGWMTSYVALPPEGATADSTR